jgi:hypothetical protein
MDVVKQNVEDLGGSVTVSSEAGRGTRFRIKLPLTLALLEGQVLQVGDQIYVLPLVAITESVRPVPGSVYAIEGAGEVVMVREASSGAAATPRSTAPCAEPRSHLGGGLDGPLRTSPKDESTAPAPPALEAERQRLTGEFRVAYSEPLPGACRSHRRLERRLAGGTLSGGAAKGAGGSKRSRCEAAPEGSRRGVLSVR